MEENFFSKILNSDSNMREMYSDIQNIIKLNCPVNKINFEIYQPNFLLGIYLIINDANEMEYIINKSKKNMEDVNDNTLLFFEPRHCVELSYILNGILFSINDTIDNNKFLYTLVDFIRFINNFPLYKEYKEYINNLLDKDIYNNLKQYLIILLNLLPFITYGNIDDLSERAFSFLSSKYNNFESLEDLLKDITNIIKIKFKLSTSGDDKNE